MLDWSETVLIRLVLATATLLLLGLAPTAAADGAEDALSCLDTIDSEPLCTIVGPPGSSCKRYCAETLSSTEDGLLALVFGPPSSACRPSC